jgi:hypothetical protein
MCHLPCKSKQLTHPSRLRAKMAKHKVNKKVLEVFDDFLKAYKEFDNNANGDAGDLSVLVEQFVLDEETLPIDKFWKKYSR